MTLSAAQSVSEDDGSVMVCVDTTQSFEREVVVSLSTSDGSAIGTSALYSVYVHVYAIHYMSLSPSLVCMYMSMQYATCLSLLV